MGSVSTIEVDEETEAGRREVYVQADGEHIGFLRASFSVLPGKIDFIVWGSVLVWYIMVWLCWCNSTNFEEVSPVLQEKKTVL